ncbi:MAG: DNA-binding protein [Euryarchaeota archaeon]
MTDPELERLRRKRMLELQRRAQDQAREGRVEERKKEEQRALEEAQRRAILRRILTPEARERLARVRLARPQLAQAVENYLIQLAQSGRLDGRVDEDQLKRLLKQVSKATRRDFKIRIERK